MIALTGMTAALGTAQALARRWWPVAVLALAALAFLTVNNRAWDRGYERRRMEQAKLATELKALADRLVIEANRNMAAADARADAQREGVQTVLHTSTLEREIHYAKPSADNGTALAADRVRALDALLAAVADTAGAEGRAKADPTGAKR